MQLHLPITSHVYYSFFSGIIPEFSRAFTNRREREDLHVQKTASVIPGHFKDIVSIAGMNFLPLSFQNARKLNLFDTS